MPDLDDVLSAALHYAGRGWAIFPTRGKVPDLKLAPHWSKDSTTDPHVIASWYAGSTGLGIGVDLGKSKLVVVDGDRLDLLDFRDRLDGWRYHGNPDRCSWLYSVNGHKIPQAVHPWGEVKSAGGYVVLPPSPWPNAGTGHPAGLRYGWDDPVPEDVDPPLMPFDVEALIAPVSGPQSDGPAWDGTEATEGQLRQAETILASQRDRVAGTSTGGRNVALNAAALIAGHLVPHYLAYQRVLDVLLDACQANGLIREEGKGACWATIKSGMNAGMKDPRQLPRDPVMLDVEVEHPEDVLFGATPELELIRQAARSRLVSPWGVLGGVLALVIAEAPPHWAIPPFIGGAASLNFAVALTGPSGTSKSTSLKVARELLGASSLSARRIGPGSGEGLLTSYLEWIPRNGATPGRMALRAHRQVLLYADEVGQIAALNARVGSTHASLLRSALTGDDLITTNADVTKNRFVPGGSYRLCVVVGVQPALASTLLDDTEEGGPQRFLWLPSQDARVPDAEPDWPTGSLGWKLPVVDRGRADVITGAVLLGYPAHVEAMARQSLRERHRAGMESTDVESHALLTRMKVAAGLAMLHGRLDVSELDWKLSELLMRLSLGVREKCVEVAGRAKVRELEGRAVARRRADAGAAGREAEEDAKAVRDLVAKHASSASLRHKGAEYGGCPHSCLRVSIRRFRGQAERLDVAVEYAVAESWVRLDDQGRLWPDVQ